MQVSLTEIWPAQTRPGTCLPNRAAQASPPLTTAGRPAGTAASGGRTAAVSAAEA
jgi:hypothetical protein